MDANNLETIINREDFLVAFDGMGNDKNGAFSNWYNSDFTLASNKYTSVEQYMMYQKAITFRRYETSRDIMAAMDAGQIHELADKNHMPLKEEELRVWRKIRKAVVKRGVRAKFSQNPELIKALLSTDNRILAQCLGDDKIWGIGIDINNPARLDTAEWLGENYMGRILMSLRNEFRINILTSGDYTLGYEDAMDKKPIEEWNLKAGQLKNHPAYYHTIHAYADTLISDDIQKGFFNTSLADTEIVISTNLGGGYPQAGFFELKQDIYDISYSLRKYAN